MQFPDSFFEDEVRNGFYVPSLVKRAWAAELELLEDIAGVCEKHHFRWFADFGTLLGAVRHGGFIPWDDDIDICMFRDDYTRFLEIAETELPAGCYIPLPKDRKDGARLHSIIWNGSKFPLEYERYEKYHEFPFLAAVDIYPLDYAASDPEEEEFRKSILSIAFYTAISTDELEKDKTELKALVARIEELFNVSFDRNTSLKDQLFLFVENPALLYTAESSRDILHPSWFLFDTPCKLSAECFNNTVMMSFEGTEMPVPAGYDKILRNYYGDYMKCCRSGSSHNYPYYKSMEKQLIDSIGEGQLPYRYLFSPDDLKRTKNGNSPGRLAENFLQLAGQIHKEIIKGIEAGDFIGARQMLELCQNSAIQIGTMLEQMQGKGLATVETLEEYCELTWRLHDELSENPTAETKGFGKQLNALLTRIKQNMEHEINMRKQVVFLPFKASLWSSLEPFWKETQADPEYDSFVVPIPYFYKTPDGSLREMQYDGEKFPDYVPVTDYNHFDLKNRMPDVIFIQNPYDEYNYTTSVHPFFYAKNIKQYTNELVYIPYFLLDEIEPEDSNAIQNMEHYVTMPGVIHSDHVIVQSEQMRLSYIDYLTNWAGKNTKNIWEEKITCSSPIPFLKMR